MSSKVVIKNDDERHSSGNRLLHDCPSLPSRRVRHADVGVPILGLAILANFYRLDPRIAEDIFNARPRFGIRRQHALDDAVAFLGHQVVKRLRGR